MTILLVALAGCATVRYEDVADFRLYEKNDPEGYALLTACLGEDATFGKITRGEAEAMATLASKINAGEALSESDFAELPCAD
ncbi:MAG: hypothetical protein OXH15_16135 [Gammaproteobacteria bacterium]|nr:hypothetical protein [Gammaproteobacteria bacterium]